MLNMSILVAEDNPDHQVLLDEVLAEDRPGVQVKIVSTGEDACHEIADNLHDGYDCVILDYNLPDGEANIWIERLTDLGCRCPILVISSSEEQEIVIKSLRSGSVDFVPKVEALVEGRLWARINLAITQRERREETRRKIKRRAQQLARLAEHDPLTGLLNRRRLDQLLTDGRQKFDRRGYVFVALLDLDYFKRINDCYGHMVGDRVLCSTAKVIKNAIGPSDYAFRYGGEEFLVIHHEDSYAEGVLWTESLLSSLEKMEINTGSNLLRVTGSIGLVECRERLNLSTIDRADQAMYSAKRRGRNNVCTWEMSCFERVARDVTDDTTRNAEDKLIEVIRRFDETLGPTQRVHLTTHAEHVSRMAAKFALALGIDGEELDNIRVAGLFHDLGKFTIPEEILAKPTILTREEKSLLSRHAAIGADMCGLLDVDSDISDIVRYHHVEYDSISTGKNGVPRGAEIMAVAEALVTMISHHEYQRGRSFSSAVRELQRLAGTLFDPEVVGTLPHALLLETPATEFSQVALEL